jgi:hypothetical protein
LRSINGTAAGDCHALVQLKVALHVGAAIRVRIASIGTLAIIAKQTCRAVRIGQASLFEINQRQAAGTQEKYGQ